MHKIIVTGGAGFIASHVADAYIAAGHKVVVIDNLSAGRRANVPARAKFYKADIRDTAAMDRIFKHERPDVLNHHAAFISVTESVKKPRETFATNVTGTLNVITAFANAGAPRGSGTGGRRKQMLFSSTGGAIYGNPKKLPADEITPPNPFSPYALSKYFAEQMITYYCKVYGISYVVFRYANVFGPRQRAQGGAGIFPIFTSLMAAGKTPVIFGNGKKTRDYVFVEDVARASVLALKAKQNILINIASGRETSDREVYDAIAHTLGFTKPPRFAPKRKGEVERISMSFKKAHSLIGWRPRFTLKEGISKTVRALGK